MSVNTNSDEQLMLDYQQGQEPAFTLLYQRYQRRLYGYLKSKNLEHSLIEEIFQNTWIRLHKTRFRYESPYKFSAWFFTLAYHEMVDVLRKEKRFKHLEILDEQKISSSEDNSNSSDLESKNELKNLAWNEISEEDRQSVEWRYLEDSSFSEIAKRLKLSEVNVRKRISRALKTLKNSFLKNK